RSPSSRNPAETAMARREPSAKTSTSWSRVPAAACGARSCGRIEPAESGSARPYRAAAPVGAGPPAGGPAGGTAPGTAAPGQQPGRARGAGAGTVGGGADRLVGGAGRGGLGPQLRQYRARRVGQRLTVPGGLAGEGVTAGGEAGGEHRTRYRGAERGAQLAHG